jgi:hypothetical protein
MIVTGEPCTPRTACTSWRCQACSDRYWSLLRGLPCTCGDTGVWTCPSISPVTPIGDCLFEPPLDCETAATLYEDAACEIHPACAASD